MEAKNFKIISLGILNPVLILLLPNRFSETNWGKEYQAKIDVLELNGDNQKRLLENIEIVRNKRKNFD